MSTGIYPQYFVNTQLNMPQMTGDVGAEGQMLAVLDAVLVTGCCPNTAQSVAIEGETIKITFGVAHGYLRLQYIDITEAVTAGLNGKHRILSVTTTTIHIAKGDLVSVNGSLKTKLSPLDWESMFGTVDPLKRAYRSKDLTSTRSVLYLDCQLYAASKYNSTNPFKRARLDVCRDMEVLGEQIESYTDYEWKPKGADYIDGAYHWFQATYSTLSSSMYGGDRPWVIVGDSKFFYFFVGFSAGPSPTTPSRWIPKSIYFFGDLPKLSAADTNNCLFSATNIDLPRTNGNMNISNSYTLDPSFNSTTYVKYIKPTSGLGALSNAEFGTNKGPSSWSGGRGFDATNPLTFSLIYSDVIVFRSEYNQDYYAGKLPYIRYILNDLAYTPEGLDLTWDKNYLLIKVSMSTSYTTDNAYIAIDMMEQRLEDNI